MPGIRRWSMIFNEKIQKHRACLQRCEEKSEICERASKTIDANRSGETAEPDAAFISPDGLLTGTRNRGDQRHG